MSRSDPPDDRRPTAGPPSGGGMLDLPLRGAGAPSPQPRRERQPPPTAPQPIAPRTQQSRRPSRGRWWIAALLLAVVAIAVYFLVRPAPAVPVPSLESIDFGELQVGQDSPSFAVSFTNGGERSMRLDRLAVAGADAASFSLMTEDCTNVEVAPLDSCTVTLQFAPESTGEKRAGLILAGNVRKDETGLPLYGLAIAPSVEAPREVDFGSHEVGGRAHGQDLVIMNGGSAPLAIRRIYIDGRDAADFAVVRGCGSRSLAVRQSCDLRVSFQPDVAGERTAELLIESDTPGRATSVRLAGRGEWSGPAAAPSPERLGFSGQKVGSTGGPQTVRLTNRSNEPLVVDAVEVSGDGFTLGRESCLAATIDPGASCSVAVTFKPAGEGEASGRLVVRGRAGQQTEVPLTGKGILPHISLDPPDLDFGATRVGVATPPRTVRIDNPGGAPLAIRGLTIEGEGREAYAIDKDGCSRAEVEGGKSCSLSIVFRPRREGSGRASLRIRSDAVEGTVSLGLFGGGTVARLSIDRPRMDFGPLTRGRSVLEPLTLSNTGTARLEVEAVRVEGAASRDFVLEETRCPLDRGLAPGEKCRLSIRFAPTADGRREAALVVRSNAAGSPASLQLRGIGVAPPAGFAASHTSFDFGELAVGERSGIRTLRIRNPGEGPLLVREIRLAGEHTGDFQIVPGSCEGIAAVTSGGDCTVGLRFTPRSPGERRARLLVAHNGPGERYTVDLAGTGFEPQP